MNETILITGITGFLGRHMYSWLSRHVSHYRIVGLSRKPCDFSAEVICSDLATNHITDALKQIQPKYIFHFAGCVGSSDWNRLFVSNVKPTVHLLESVVDAGIRTRVVLPGSAAEYGTPDALPIRETHSCHPVSSYGLSKMWQMSLAPYFHSYGLDIVVGRIFNVIGAGMSTKLAIGSFCNQIQQIVQGAQTPQIQVGNLKSRRDYLVVEDSSSAMFTLAQKGKSGEIYNVCSGESVETLWILDEMLAAVNTPIEIIVCQDRFKQTDVNDIYGSNEKLRQLGWRPESSIAGCIRNILGEGK